MNPELPEQLERLKSRYLAFRQRLPLSLDTRNRLAELAEAAGVSKTIARRILAFWTHTTAYLKTLAAPGAVRHSLDGEPGEPVSTEHQEQARAILEQRRAKIRENGKVRKRKPEPLRDSAKAVPVPDPEPDPQPEPPARPVLKLKRVAS